MKLLSLGSPGERPLLGIILLVVVLIGANSLTWLMAFREPDYNRAVDVIQCHAPGLTTGPYHDVALPYAAPAAGGGPAQALHCMFEIDLDADAVRSAALFIPSFNDTLVIGINGVQIASRDIVDLRKLRWVQMPAYVPIDDKSLHPGINRFDVDISALDMRIPALDRIYLGDRGALRSDYQVRWFANAVLPTMIVGADLALAMLFGLIWAMRRRDTEYGWLALVLLFGGVRGSVIIPDFGIGAGSTNFWNLLILWETTAALMFMRAIAGEPYRRWNLLFVVVPAAVSSILLIAPRTVTSYAAVGAAMTCCYVVLGMWSLLRAAMRGSQDCLVMLLGFGMVLMFIAHDSLIIVGVGIKQVYLARGALSGLVIAICALMVARFLRAMREADQTAEALRARVSAAEAELRTTYEELRQRREAEAVEQERSRLMRDLHDGLGGDLASMLALADSPDPKSGQIAAHARSALADMRLIIASLEDFGGDLTLALGAWRERLDPQLRASGLSLEWRVEDLPSLPRLGPTEVLDVLRIVQEAITNVQKHARASRITLAARAVKRGVEIVIRDDGVGLAESGPGNGLRNMAMRAARLGGTVDVARNDGGTEVILTILHDPDADARSPDHGMGEGRARD